MNAAIKRPEISPENAQKLTNELWDKLTENGFAAWGKADLVDFLLYLLNKHDDKRFFDANTNAQNERVLKMPAAKIKTSKKNIAVKFMDDDEFEGVFEKFLHALNQGYIAINDGGAGKIRLVIENPVFRAALESRLKSSTQDSFDYTLNSEKVEISTEIFVKMLQSEAQRLEKSDELNKALKECKSTKNLQDFNAAIKAISKAPTDFGASFISEFVPKFCSAIYQKIKRKDQK